ncbi:MAG: sulfotransferase family protein [Nostocales cyanobacterium 94392]|nr:sulfotransferase family protein [Nostocales cyanobacterium 94392]
MLSQTMNKLKFLPLVEPSTLLQRINVKLANDWNKEHGAWKKLIVNHDHRFLYCPIHKNASSSLLKAIVALTDYSKKEDILKSSRNTIRLYADLNLTLANYTYIEAKKIINSDYLKFAIVRNPWSRLVSTYLNIFVNISKGKPNTNLNVDVAKYIYGENNYLQYKDSITFEQLVEYVYNTNNKSLDKHCVPQHCFLGNLKYDFIGRMENLYSDLKYINDRLNLSIELPKINQTEYSTSIAESQNYWHKSPDEIRKCKYGFPNYQEFYNPYLTDLAAQKYANDIETFGYEF